MTLKTQKLLVGTLGFLLFISVGLAGYREHEKTLSYRKGLDLISLPRPLSDTERKGQQLYHERQCDVCHGRNGAGGVANFNSATGGIIAGLRGISESYSKKELIAVILDGKKNIQRKDETLPWPPLDMPGYKKTLSTEEAAYIADFLWVLTTK